MIDLEFAAESKSAFSVGWKLLRACINCDYGFTGLVAICSCRILREKFLAFTVTQLAQDFSLCGSWWRAPSSDFLPLLCMGAFTLSRISLHFHLHAPMCETWPANSFAISLSVRAKVICIQAIYVMISSTIQWPSISPSDDSQFLTKIFLKVLHYAWPLRSHCVRTKSRINHTKLRSILQIGHGADELLLRTISIIFLR